MSVDTETSPATQAPDTDQLRANGSPVAVPPVASGAKPTDRLAAAEKHSKFWQNAHYYFDRVYQTMNLDPLWRAMLSSPKRVLTVSCPIRMDDGSIQVFTGYRAQHNNALGPFKGGIRYYSAVNQDEVM